MRSLRGKGPHFACSAIPPGFSRVAEGALDLRRGPQGPAMVASGLASPHSSCSGASPDSSPVKPGLKSLCGVGAGNSGFLSGAVMDLGILLESPQGSQPSSREGACTCPFLQSGSSSVTQSAAWIKGSMVFPRVFPMRLSHAAFPQGCPTCTRGGSQS